VQRLGLLHWLTGTRGAEPYSAPLVGQATDPRLAALDWPHWQVPHQRQVWHVDGTAVHLRYAPPPSPRTHLRRCAADSPELLAYLES